MDENRKRFMKPLLMITIPFLAGFILSWYIWGYSKARHVDHKQVLQDTITYIATIESTNKNLADKVDNLETEVAALSQKGQQAGDAGAGMVSSLNRRIQSLESENVRLKSAVRNIETLARENPQLKERIQALVQVADTGNTP